MATRQSRTDAGRGQPPTREAEEAEAKRDRPVSEWSPAKGLRTPEGDPDNTYRWVAEYVNGTPMPQNVAGYLSQGFVRVSYDDLLSIDPTMAVEPPGSDGYSRASGHILMRISNAGAAARNRYYAERQRTALEGADILQGVREEHRVAAQMRLNEMTSSEINSMMRELPNRA